MWKGLRVTLNQCEVTPKQAHCRVAAEQVPPGSAPAPQLRGAGVGNGAPNVQPSPVLPSCKILPASGFNGILSVRFTL